MLPKKLRPKEDFINSVLGLNAIEGFKTSHIIQPGQAPLSLGAPTSVPQAVLTKAKRGESWFLPYVVLGTGKRKTGKAIKISED